GAVGTGGSVYSITSLTRFGGERVPRAELDEGGNRGRCGQIDSERKTVAGVDGQSGINRRRGGRCQSSACWHQESGKREIRTAILLHWPLPPPAPRDPSSCGALEDRYRAAALSRRETS